MKPYHTSGGVRLYHGRAEEVLPALGERFTATVCDPPYGLGEVKDLPGLLRAWLLGGDGTQHAGPGGFMGKRWDALVPAPCVFERVFEAMLPGAPMLCFAGSRTQDLMGLSLRLAGFELTDCIMWVYGQGFGGKGANISKDIDYGVFRGWLERHRPGALRLARRLWNATEKDARAYRWCEIAAARFGGIEGKRGVLGFYDTRGLHQPEKAGRQPIKKQSKHTYAQDDYSRQWTTEAVRTAPATPEAALWEGYNSTLCPAYEPVLYAVRPLDSTYAEGALENGVAGLNIDAGRIPTNGEDTSRPMSYAGRNLYAQDAYTKQMGWGGGGHPSGRWPANVLLGCACPDPARHLDGCAVAMLDAQTGVTVSTGGGGLKTSDKNTVNTFGKYADRRLPDTIGHGDTGGVSRYFKIIRPLEGERFFYTSKADKRDRGPGNSWPTVKPQLLVAYLCRLVTYPERNLLLDPFSGSGTSGVVCKRLSLPCVLIDSDEEACEIAARRLDATSVLPFPEEAAPEPQAVPEQASLFS